MMKDERRTAKKEEAKQCLSERQEGSKWWNSELHTRPKSRKVRAKQSFDKMVVRAVIEVWRWAPGERTFIIPMTKPSLTQDQEACLLAEFFEWDERQPVEA